MHGRSSAGTAAAAKFEPESEESPVLTQHGLAGAAALLQVAGSSPAAVSPGAGASRKAGTGSEGSESKASNLRPDDLSQGAQQAAQALSWLGSSASGTQLGAS